jgi:hypothetical protein
MSRATDLYLQIVSFWTLVSFLRLSEILRGKPRAALRPRTEPCGPEKSLEEGPVPYDSRNGVELTGIEPVASGLQSPRSPS